METSHLPPEIIWNIVGFNDWHRGPRMLYKCLLINKTFSIEATKILWSLCGGGYESFSSPAIKDLARIVKNDKERGQYYANFIQCLVFFDEGELGVGECYTEEARFHEDLQCLEFPRLEWIEFSTTNQGRYMNTGEAMVQYAGSKLETFRVESCSNISNSTLKRLSQSSPNLKEFTIMEAAAITATKSGVVYFFNNAQCLTDIDIRNTFSWSWSKDVFEALARHPALNSITIPDIDENWIQVLDENSFPSLTNITTGMSHVTLNALAESRPDMAFLYLEQQRLPLPPDNRILQPIARFANLYVLQINFGEGCRVNGYDLVKITKSCPELSTLAIGSSGGFQTQGLGSPEGKNPFGEGINDAIIEEMTSFMPQIKTLGLVFENPGLMSWKSVLCLGRGCKSLRKLNLSCDAFWKDDLLLVEKNMFPLLNKVELVLDTSNRPSTFDMIDENFEVLAAKFISAAPSVEDLKFFNGNEFDDLLQRTIENLITDRMS